MALSEQRMALEDPMMEVPSERERGWLWSQMIRTWREASEQRRASLFSDFFISQSIFSSVENQIILVLLNLDFLAISYDFLNETNCD